MAASAALGITGDALPEEVFRILAFGGTIGLWAQIVPDASQINGSAQMVNESAG